MDDIRMDDIPEGGNKIVTWTVTLLVIFIIVAAAAFLIYRWLNPNTTHNSSSEVAEYSNYLSCSAKAVRESFFNLNDTTAVEHQIKVVFSNAKPSKINYVFKGTYASEEVARQKNSSLHADYNIYLGEHDVNAESLTPNFSVIGDELAINLSAEKGFLNTATAPVFLLSSDEAMKFFTLSSDEVAKIYNRQGMSCVLYE